MSIIHHYVESQSIQREAIQKNQVQLLSGWSIQELNPQSWHHYYDHALTNWANLSPHRHSRSEFPWRESEGCQVMSNWVGRRLPLPLHQQISSAYVTFTVCCSDLAFQWTAYLQVLLIKKIDSYAKEGLVACFFLFCFFVCLFGFCFNFFSKN